MTKKGKKTYECELCHKVFDQKVDFMRHTTKKVPCISMDKIQQLNESKMVAGDNKTKLKTIFTYCLDVLRNNEHLTGDKALRTLAHLLDLRLLEKQFDGQIDIDNYDYDFSQYDDDIVEQHRTKLLRLVRFSNLVKEKEEDIPRIMKYIWEDILSVHPTTKNIFLRGKGFDIQHQSTYKKLIDRLFAFDFDSVEEDILGEAYEEVIKDIMTGKVLGQFFTPPKVKQMMVKLVDPQVKEDGTIETIFDPAMGTGGFLITSLRHLCNQSNKKGIKMDWGFVSEKGLGGREAEPDTYQLAVSNMLISSGHMFKVLEKGDSIRSPITKKYEISLANPPFGIDGLMYDDIKNPLRDECMPIRSNSAVPLFLQTIISILKVHGRCAVVLPNGKELFSKGKELVALREYLTKTCDVKGVYYLPPVFTHTSISTCVLHFIKKKEGTDVLETKIEMSKTQKEKGREYKFSKTHQTSKVRFYNYNPENGMEHLLIDVPIEKISSNSYSLNYAEYLKEESDEEKYDEGVEVKTLGEVCKFKNGKGIKKDRLVAGKYPVIGGGKAPMGYHNQYNNDENTILCSSSGAYAGFISRYNQKTWSSDCFSIIPDKNLINNSYLYYLLKTIQGKIYNLQTGTAQPHVYSKTIQHIKIPIPSLELQQEIVQYLDFIYEKAIKTSEEKIRELKTLNGFCLMNQKRFGNNVVKTLRDVSIINPKTLKKGQYTSINYIDISSVKEGRLNGVQKITENFPSRAKRIVQRGDILYSSVRPNLQGYVYIDDVIENGIASTGFAQVRVKNKITLLPKYLYYIMTCDYINDELVNRAKGAQYPAVSFEDFESLKIPIPSLERQQEIVAYCETNDALIKQLENEIENHKKQAHLFMSNVVKPKQS